MREFKTLSAGETANVGYMLGKVLKPGDVVCLNGELGTGKTAFTGGIARSKGIGGYITSPTFTIVNEYTGEIPLYHFDVYRISDADEMFEIGFQEYMDGDGITVIEWADLIKEALPPDFINVNIKKDITQGLDTRIISIQFIGDKYRVYDEEMIL